MRNYPGRETSEVSTSLSQMAIRCHDFGSLLSLLRGYVRTMLQSPEGSVPRSACKIPTHLL